MSYHLRTTVALCAASLVWLGAGGAEAGLIAEDAVFAHNFESISGDNITALFGPTAVKTSNVSASSTNTLPFSSQHVQFPNAQVARIDTNTQLTTATSELSFSIYYNAQNDTSSGLKRFLSSYDGTGSIDTDEFIFDFGASNKLRFASAKLNVYSDGAIPRDDQWHQVGFVHDSGTVRFYLDGQPFGTDKSFTPGSVAPQGNEWFLVEDAPVANLNHEFFDNGLYDEAALWTRALSDWEMGLIAAEGVAVPEPSTCAVWAVGLALLAGCARRRRRKAC